MQGMQETEVHHNEFHLTNKFRRWGVEEGECETIFEDVEMMKTEEEVLRKRNV